MIGYTGLRSYCRPPRIHMILCKVFTFIQSLKFCFGLLSCFLKFYPKFKILFSALDRVCFLNFYPKFPLLSKVLNVVFCYHISSFHCHLCSCISTYVFVYFYHLSASTATCQLQVDPDTYVSLLYACIN